MILTLIAAASLLQPTVAAAQTMYRYVDPSGHVVYSDRPPPPTAKDVEPRALTPNVIDTDSQPFATREAMKRAPVTLYTFDCDVCRSAEAMLAKRGVPHSVVIVTEEQGAAKLKALTGNLAAPVLQVGAREVAIGYDEARWQAMLDQAGYPKNAPPLRAGSTAERTSAPANAPRAAPNPASTATPAASAGGNAASATTAKSSSTGGSAPKAPAPGTGVTPAAAPAPGPGTGYPQ